MERLGVPLTLVCTVAVLTGCGGAPTSHALSGSANPWGEAWTKDPVGQVWAATGIQLCTKGHAPVILAQWTAQVGDHWIAPLHVHHEDDEAWYVLRGRLGFRLGDEEFEVGPGAAVLARRGTPHTWRNAGDVEAEFLLVMPPRIASLVEALHQPAADMPALFEAHASEILG